MRGQLFLYMTGFTLFLLLLVWLVQILLLDIFYERSKYRELDAAANALVYFIEDESSIATAVYDYASRYDLCISVYRIDGNTANELARSHVAGACAVHLLSDGERTELYEEARDGDGTLSVTYPVVRQFIERDPVRIEDNAEETLPEDDITGHIVEEES
ncbi:MAG: hypothetical protein J6B77_10135, partial [Clostridia bacterium]|nr:hypothetical protein [Clostridia bacterium]